MTFCGKIFHSQEKENRFRFFWDEWGVSGRMRGCEEERGGVVRGGEGATVTKLRSLESAKVRYQSASFRPYFCFIFYISL